MIDLTPEHASRQASVGPHDLHPEVAAAYKYVDSVLPTADAQSPVGGYAWHGWALREAFLAGCTHTRTAQAEPVGELSPKEVEAQDAFTQMRDEILNLSDGVEVNEVLGIIDNYTPEWV